MHDANRLGHGHIPVCLAAGSIGLLVLGVEPILLGALTVEGRLSEGGVGPLAMCELTMIALGSLGGLRLLRFMQTQAVLAGGSILLVLANLLLVGRSGLPWLAMGRGMAGVGEGTLLALAGSAIATSVNPERLSAFFLAAQTILQLVVAQFMPSVLWRGSATDGALLILSLSGVASLMMVPWAPRRLRPPPPDPAGGGIPGNGIVLLATAGLYIGGIIATWSYLGVVLGHFGYSSGQRGSLVALCLGSQVIGAFAVARWGEYLADRAVILAAAMIQPVLVAVLALAGAVAWVPWVFVAGYGFLWLFGQPFYTGMLISVDRRRRAVLYLPVSQLAGSALVPFMASIIVDHFGAIGALWFSVGTFLSGGVLILLVTWQALPEGVTMPDDPIVPENGR